MTTGTAASEAPLKAGEIKRPVIVSDETLARVEAILDEYIHARFGGGGRQDLRAVKVARGVRHQVRIRRLEARRKTGWGRKLGVDGV